MIDAFQTQLIARIQATWPDALGDSWGQESVACFWELLTLTEPVSVGEDWEGIEGGEGVVIAALMLASHLADPLSLLASLSEVALQEAASPATPEGDLAWDWTAKPQDASHVASEAGVALQLRFTVKAQIVRRLAPADPTPTGVYAGYEPDVGEGHEADYVEVIDEG